MYNKKLPKIIIGVLSIISVFFLFNNEVYAITYNPTQSASIDGLGGVYVWDHGLYNLGTPTAGTYEGVTFYGTISGVCPWTQGVNYLGVNYHANMLYSTDGILWTSQEMCVSHTNVYIRFLLDTPLTVNGNNSIGLYRDWGDYGRGLYVNYTPLGSQPPQPTFTPFIFNGYTSTSTYSGINIGGVYINGTTNAIKARITSIDGVYAMNYFIPTITAVTEGNITGTPVHIGDTVIDYTIFDIPNSNYEIYYYPYDALTGYVTPTPLASTSFTLTQTNNPTTVYPPSIYTEPTGTSTNNSITCNPTSGFFENSLCNLGIYLFKPNQTSFNNLKNLYDTLNKKPPFGYIAIVTDTMGQINASSTDILGLPYNATLENGIIGQLKNAISIMIWLMLCFWIFERFRHFTL